MVVDIGAVAGNNTLTHAFILWLIFDNCTFVAATGDDTDKFVFCLVMVLSIVAAGVISGSVNVDGDNVVLLPMESLLKLFCLVPCCKLTCLKYLLMLLMRIQTFLNFHMNIPLFVNLFCFWIGVICLFMKFSCWCWIIVFECRMMW